MAGTFPATLSTKKEPVAVPLAIVHVAEPGLIRVVGSVIEHEPSDRAKPVPVTATDVPLGPEVGDRMTVCGITPSGADAVSVVAPVTVTI